MLAFFFARGAWKALIWSLGASVLFAIIPLVFISPQIFSQFSVALGNFDASVVPLAHNESLVGLFIQIANLLHIAPAVGELAAQGLAGILAVVGVGALLALTFSARGFPGSAARNMTPSLISIG
jgi:hypothetical protein